MNYTDYADIVVHEATFRKDDEERARKHGHSTTKEAADFANALNAKTLFPCHFDLHSGIPVDEYKKEVKENFKGKVILPEELKRYDLCK